MSFNAEELLASLANAGGGDNKLMPSADLNLVLEIASALKKFSVDGNADKIDLSASNNATIAPGSYRFNGAMGDANGAEMERRHLQQH